MLFQYVSYMFIAILCQYYMHFYLISFNDIGAGYNDFSFLYLGARQKSWAKHLTAHHSGPQRRSFLLCCVGYVVTETTPLCPLSCKVSDLKKLLSSEHTLQKFGQWHSTTWCELLQSQFQQKALCEGLSWATSVDGVVPGVMATSLFLQLSPEESGHLCVGIARLFLHAGKQQLLYQGDSRQFVSQKVYILACR